MSIEKITPYLLEVTRSPFIPLTLRKKIGQFLSFKEGEAFETKIFDQVYAGEHGIHMDDKIYRYGMHEAATVRLLRNIAVEQKISGIRPVYMDVGTNAGMHLLGIANVVIKAYGFEPWAEIREKAQQNLERNKLSHVTLFHYGLSDRDAVLPFSPPSANNMGVGAIRKDGAAGDENAITVRVREGDSVVQENKIAPTLIKIDVEGHEKAVLQGLKQTLEAYKPTVIFEYSDMSRSDFGTAEARKALFGPEYKFYGIRRSREYPSLEEFDPFKKYENVLASAINPLPSMWTGR